jgi:hypothetical protein
MKTEDINRAIAEACGWIWSMPDECYYRNGSPIGHEVPNYCEDLNAMHEAEKTIGFGKYLDQLWKLVNPHYQMSPCHPLNFLTKNMVFAKPAQRAEAFLRTIGKWVEEAENDCTRIAPTLK